MEQFISIMQQVGAVLIDPYNLTIAFLFAVGYFLRSIPKFPNGWITSVVVVIGMAATPFIIVDGALAHRIVRGFVYGAISCALYEAGGWWVVDKLDSLFGKKRILPVVAIMAICLFLPACAGTTKSDADAVAANVSKSLEDASVRATIKAALRIGGIVGLSQVKDSIDKQAIKDQLLAWGTTVEKLLMSGEPITGENLIGIFSTFQSSLDAEKFASQFGEFTSVVNEWIVSVSDSNNYSKSLRLLAVILAEVSISLGNS